MNDKLQTDTEQLSELKEKVERYEKWHSSAFYRNTELEYTTNKGDEVDLRELWEVLWGGRWKVIGITFVVTLASIIYALSLPNIYKSEALLMPNTQEHANGSTAINGTLGGLASLAGVSINSMGTDKTTYALEVLRSREFLFRFLEKYDLKHKIYAVEGWSRGTNELLYDSSIYDSTNSKWTRKVEEPLNAEPYMIEVYEHFINENLSVELNKETGMIKLSVRHYSPMLAKEIVEQLTNFLNDTIKNEDISEALKSIKYLEDELSRTNLADARTMFFQLIEKHQQTLLLTKVRDDYVFKVVDSAIVPLTKDKPSRKAIVVASFLVSIVFSLAFIFMNHFFIGILKDEK